MQIKYVGLFIFIVWSNNVFAQWTDHLFSFDGKERSYKIYFPESYSAGKPASLIFLLHGLGGSKDDVNGVSNIKAIADTANIILVSPQALDYENPIIPLPGAWNSGVVARTDFGDFAINGEVDDVGFLTSLLDTLLHTASIDHKRVYFCGFSMGGFMTQRMACALSERITAIASLGGTYSSALPLCNPSAITPVAHFHGTNDNVVDWNGNFIFNGFPLKVGLAVDTLIANWITYNKCTSIPLYDLWPDNNQDGLYVEHYAYLDDDNRSTVELFKINGGYHLWYDNTNTGNEIDYATEIWKFFNKQKQNTSNTLNIEKDKLLIYPNPVKDDLYISGIQGSDLSIIITDISGKVLKKSVLKSNHFSTHNFDPGLYIISIILQDGKVINSKFVKE